MVLNKLNLKKVAVLGVPTLSVGWVGSTFAGPPFG